MELPHPLSGSVTGSFAYETIKDRLPVIVTRIVDLLYRERTSIAPKFCVDGLESVKLCVSLLSKLKNEMQTNKAIEPLSFEHDNGVFVTYNTYLEEFEKEHSSPACWFTTSWLFAECYLYARIHESFRKSSFSEIFDPFWNQKKMSLCSSQEAVLAIACFFQKLLPDIDRLSAEDRRLLFSNLIQISLWGNQNDLSITAGKTCYQGNPLEELAGNKGNIISDDFNLFWNYLITSNEDSSFGFILDNAGFELFTDLCLASLLTESRICKSVTFYVKTMPWFVSDTTKADFDCVLKYTSQQKDSISLLSVRWRQYLTERCWTIREHTFWTTHYSFPEMKTVDQHLYAELKQHSCLIFKGDLNYRKLTGDLDWPVTTPFREALQGFHPTALLVLRTVKGGPVVGIDSAGVKIISNAPSDWNTSGKFGMIQFTDRETNVA